MNTVFYEKRTEDVFAGFICDHPYPTHLHDVVEIVCLLTGHIQMTIAGKSLSLIPGDIAIAFPAIAHSYDMVSEDATGLTFVFAADTIIEFYHTFRTMQPIYPLLPAHEQAPELSSVIAGFQKICAQNGSSPLKLGYLHLFLSYLFSSLPLQPVARQVPSTMAYQALHYISVHFTEPLSLESTARALGISRIHLSHIFSQQLHINFRQYINGLRIDHARTLLHNPAYSISQIAYQCGYGNPRTFHRAFLAQCGIAPNQYRASLSDRMTP